MNLATITYELNNNTNVEQVYTVKLHDILISSKLSEMVFSLPNGMVAYFCHQLSDNYVDLSDNYVDLSDLYVDLSDHYVDLSENYHHN